MRTGTLRSTAMWHHASSGEYYAGCRGVEASLCCAPAKIGVLPCKCSCRRSTMGMTAALLWSCAASAWIACCGRLNRSGRRTLTGPASNVGTAAALGSLTPWPGA
eukprot:309648-Chlamydomonas_euryale.AAC.1